jgi:hypothetical protein
MKISKLTRQDMNPIDGSDNVKYSAKLDNDTLHYKTDGIWHNHLSIEEGEEKVKSIYQ